MHRTSILGIAVALAVLAIAATASAAVVTLHADFDGLQVVPPDASPAFGTFDGTLDDTSGAFTVTSGSYLDLLGTSLSIFLNTGAAGNNGAFILTLTNDSVGATSGTFSGNGVLTAPQIASMLADSTYLRVTSTVFPAGEIRGQVTVVPEPASLLLLACGGLGVWAVARRNRRIVRSSGL